jgi:16S rRNA (guanine527-N7)-methyltransferase
MTILSSLVDAAALAAVESDLRAFSAMVLKWNQHINLISKSTEAQIWSRHIEDSLQLWPLAPLDAKLWVDVGSGGGFPGIVIAILAKMIRPQMALILVESDQRKAAFLLQAVQAFSLNAQVFVKRAESLDHLNADVVSARALAPLVDLLGYAANIASPIGVLIFPKGERADAEIKIALQDWQFCLQQIQSSTNPAATLLRITDLRHV